MIDDEVETDAGDALMGALPAYMDYDWEDSRFCHVYNIWGDKTQGKPYHMYLLAVACLIETRLGRKAFVYGDITRGQCKKAVKMANKFLDIPDRCDMRRLLKRVSELPLSDNEQLAVFKKVYLGTQDAEFGKYMRSKYSESICEKYWEDRFKHTFIGTHGFDKIIGEYLLWGFDLEKLCKLVNFADNDGNLRYKEFINCIMDAKLHIKEKNCKDVLEINQEESHPYSVATLFAQFAFAGAKNKKVNRFIPIEEIRKALNNQLADKCDVNTIINEYLAEETKQSNINKSENGFAKDEMESAGKQDAADMFSQFMDTSIEKLQKELEKYDITNYEDLRYYEKGDTMHPMLMKALGRSYNVYKSALQENDYDRLMQTTADNRCRWLIENNRDIIIRDIDWENIFIDIKDNEESFGRYYPMMRVRLDSNKLVDMVKAIVLNKELYIYCQELVEIYGN